MKHLIHLTLLFLFLVFEPVLKADSFLESLEIYKQDSTPFRSPSLRQLQYESPNNIQWTLQMKGVPTKYWDFWNQIIKGEERGAFGYHAATVKNYEAALRTKIRQLPRNQQKVESYKQKLKAHWYVND